MQRSFCVGSQIPGNSTVSSTSDVWNCIVADLKHFQGLIFSFVLLFFAFCLHSYFMRRLSAGLSVSYIQCITGDTFVLLNC